MNPTAISYEQYLSQRDVLFISMLSKTIVLYFDNERHNNC